MCDVQADAKIATASGSGPSCIRYAALTTSSPQAARHSLKFPGFYVTAWCCWHTATSAEVCAGFV